MFVYCSKKHKRIVKSVILPFLYHQLDDLRIPGAATLQSLKIHENTADSEIEEGDFAKYKPCLVWNNLNK